mmetsp:Transcript_13692/g.45675  ORF Transcript_13692/g.45675 Transcript_13692/m.45675 type:complete len:324 (-) Transcript_13692:892-1863(-)
MALEHHVRDRVEAGAAQHAHLGPRPEDDVRERLLQVDARHSLERHLEEQLERLEAAVDDAQRGDEHHALLEPHPVAVLDRVLRLEELGAAAAPAARRRGRRAEREELVRATLLGVEGGDEPVRVQRKGLLLPQVAPHAEEGRVDQPLDRLCEQVEDTDRRPQHAERALHQPLREAARPVLERAAVRLRDDAAEADDAVEEHRDPLRRAVDDPDRDLRRVDAERVRADVRGGEGGEGEQGGRGGGDAVEEERRQVDHLARQLGERRVQGGEVLRPAQREGAAQPERLGERADEGREEAWHAARDVQRREQHEHVRRGDQHVVGR